MRDFEAGNTVNVKRVLVLFRRRNVNGLMKDSNLGVETWKSWK